MKTCSIIGGCGHVGLPLGVSLALAENKVYLVDVNEHSIEKVNSGKFPFLERGGDEKLAEVVGKNLFATNDPEKVSESDIVIFVTGTPVDEHLNPKVSEVSNIFDFYKDYFKKGALVIMRSTLAPGTMRFLKDKIETDKVDVKLAFCPERVAQGYALDEIDSLPQIVSAFDEESFEEAKDLFLMLAPKVIKLSPVEAEITKLMANSWRYLEFAIANQFYMIAEESGIDFYKIYEAIRYEYPRANGYKMPGFAAGPCLFKDTMQLASFFDHRFYLGHSAMLVNENLASFVVKKLEALVNERLSGKVIGLLGMTFKANNDDIRESLSYRVKKALEFKGAKVIFHDPYLEDSKDLDEVLGCSEGLILCTPHREYLDLDIKKPLVDVWGIYSKPEIEVIEK